MTHPTDELALLNKLIELGAAAAQESAKANSDDGMAGSIAQGRFYELRHQMRALLAEQARTEPHKAEDAPSDAMVDAYLTAQRAAVEEADRFGRPNVGGLHTNTVREACRAGLRAAIAQERKA